jgi:hypothetical protein
VLTQHNDNARTGANLSETVLTTANVNSSQFGKLFCWSVDDQVYTQPLLVPRVNLAAGGMRDVVYVATMNDTVYAFDANDSTASTPLWSRSFLGPGVTAVRASDMTGACGGAYKDISGNIGVVGTPVVDPASNTLYLVARTKENGSGFVQRLHALDIRDGSERPGSPVTIQASMPGKGDGGSTVVFDPQKNNQRAALLLDGGVLYVSWASHCDWGPYHGWLLGYDPQTLKQVLAYNATPDGQEGGIWMAGQGPAADGSGSIYLTTGNGTVGVGSDPTNVRNRGESFLRLTRSGAGLTVATFFTPHDYLRMEAGDLDFGAAGAMLVPNSNLAVTGGKTSKLYAIDRTEMGGVVEGWRSEPPGVQVAGLYAQHLHGSPVYWASPGGPLIYTWAEYDHLKSFRIDPTASHLDPVAHATSPEAAPNGMPGAFLSISANGGIEGTGILWSTLPLSGDANQAVVPGEMHAFDAANVGVELWNSTQNANDAPGNLAKFTSPTVANGRVYVATFSNALCVYGELPNVAALDAPTGLTVSSMSKTSALLQWTSHSTTETGFAIERKEGFLGFARIAVAPAGASSFVDGSVLPFGIYNYRVRALGSPAPSAYSNSACVTTSAGTPAPRLQVSGFGHPIPSGSSSPSWTTNTDFGGCDIGATVSETFLLQNVGSATLHLLSAVAAAGASAGAFSIGGPPPASLAPGATAPLGVTFSPTSVGRMAATLGIESDDPDQAMYTFAVSAVTTGDLVGWWKLDESTGTTAADASGDENVGTASAVTWVPGHSGGAASFDGATSYISVPDDVTMNPRTITVAAWINPADWNGNRRIVQKGAFDDQYRLLAENKVLKFDIGGVGTVTTALPPTLTWTHVAGTYDGSTMALYINGSQVASTPASAYLPSSPDPLTIGNKPQGPPSAGPPSPGDHFRGSIDEVRVYGRALSAAEVATIAK